jgi:membrane-associated phospholipid phosphatase
MTIDVAVNVFMRSLETSTLTYLSKFVAVALEPFVVIFLSLIIALYLYLKRSKKQGILFAATIFVTGILIKLLKEIFQKARPLDSLVQDVGFSFPSGHTLMTVVFLGLLFYFFTNRKLWMVLVVAVLVVFVGFTRLYLGVHWLTDIVASFVLGAVILLVFVISAERYGS